LGIPDGDVVVLSSKIEILREIDFLFQIKAHESTATTFESKEDDQRLEALQDRAVAEWQRNKLRRNKKFGFWPKKGTVKLATIHSFKGWEAPTLFLIIERQPLKNHATEEEFASDELIYTAITRCIQNLIIINLGNAKYRDFFREHMPLVEAR